MENENGKTDMKTFFQNMAAHSQEIAAQKQEDETAFNKWYYKAYDISPKKAWMAALEYARSQKTTDNHG